MNGCPPQPGLTDMHRTRSAAASARSTEAAGVPGFRAMPARQPASRIASSVRFTCASASKWNGDAVGARPRELLDVIRRALDHQVDVDRAAGVVHLVGDRAGDERADGDRRDEVAVHDVDVDHPRAGRPSPRRPARRAGRSRPTGSTERRDGRRRARAPGRVRLPSWPPSDGLQHRAAAMLAAQVLGGAHPDDRLMRPALGAPRDELVAPQAVDASVAARELGRAQPGLAASGTDRALERRLFFRGRSHEDAIVAPGDVDALGRRPSPRARGAEWPRR